MFLAWSFQSNKKCMFLLDAVGRVGSAFGRSRSHSYSCENGIESFDRNNVAAPRNDDRSLRASRQGPIEGVLEMQPVAKQFENFFQIFRTALKHGLFLFRLRRLVLPQSVAASEWNAISRFRNK